MQHDCIRPLSAMPRHVRGRVRTWSWRTHGRTLAGGADVKGACCSALSSRRPFSELPPSLILGSTLGPLSMFRTSLSLGMKMSLGGLVLVPVSSAAVPASSSSACICWSAMSAAVPISVAGSPSASVRGVAGMAGWNAAIEALPMVLEQKFIF